MLPGYILINDYICRKIVFMDLRKLLSFKDWFSYRQKIGLLVVAGVVCGLGGLFMYLLRAHTYFSR